MASVSSAGIGGGLEVPSIGPPLVALGKQPLTRFEAEAGAVQTRVSVHGQIKSRVSNLSEAASRLANASSFHAVRITSSHPATVWATALVATGPKSLAVKVESLAKGQATASAALLPVGGALGAGTLRLQLGQWTIVPSSFSPQVGSVSVDIVVSDSDTVSDVARKLNRSHAGVSATVQTDGSGERLLLQSHSTGAHAGFALSVVHDASGHAAGACQ